MRSASITALLLLTACAVGEGESVAPPDATGREEPVMSSTDPVILFSPREVAPGEILPPPTLLRMEGTLRLATGCLVLDNGMKTVALAFDRASGARFADGTLVIGENRFPLGTRVYVDGPSNDVSRSFDVAAAKARCKTTDLWFVGTNAIGYAG